MSDTTSLRPISKVLVANRGEIALRIMRTLRSMGVSSVAVYSDVDAGMPFARYADEAVHIGPATAAESYLVFDPHSGRCSSNRGGRHPSWLRILERECRFRRSGRSRGHRLHRAPSGQHPDHGRQAVGQGSRCPAAGPACPGSDGELTDLDEAERLAAEIGFPVMVKASAGGGGKGMRVVHDPTALRGETERAMSEAKSAFGNGAVFLERFVTEPRHIEIQVLCDQHGHGVYLFERGAASSAATRRSWKKPLLPLLDDDLRDRMGSSACALDCARSCGYVGAGTVEFLVDADREFLLPGNEHAPASGASRHGDDHGRGPRGRASPHRRASRFGCTQDLRIQGHAIELRVYAEDRGSCRIPAVHRHLGTHIAPEGPGIRVDAGVEQAAKISIHYDPMIAKLCPRHGPDPSHRAPAPRHR